MRLIKRRIVCLNNGFSARIAGRIESSNGFGKIMEYFLVDILSGIAQAVEVVTTTLLMNIN